MHPNNNARAHAAVLLHRVAFGGRSLDTVLAEARLPSRDGPLIQELTFGAVRHFFSLSSEIEHGLITPLKPRDSILFCLLIIGVYQLRHTRVPAYAAVSETVNATRQIGRPWARGLVNQILRAIDVTSPPIHPSEEAKWDHPRWLIELVRADFPDDWEAILAANLTRAPQTLRVNRRLNTRDEYLTQLRKHGVSAHIGISPDALVVDAPVSTSNLPGYADGLVSIQDAGAQWAAPLLAPVAGDRVLDACAAPGGKAMHLWEHAPGIELVALDHDRSRCDLMRTEFCRLQVDASIVVDGDATNLAWWDGNPFHRILLDAPCSGTGTLRRHPDIKLLKHPSDLHQYQQLQTRLLTNLWRALAPGGRLLYCTCSVLSIENDSVIDHLIATNPCALVKHISAAWGEPTRHGRQLLPELGGADGFYYSILEKE
jgi:16S rRNA (cytosine967-C5)-methyltransferase